MEVWHQVDFPNKSSVSGFEDLNQLQTDIN